MEEPQIIILLPMERCARILDYLVDPRRDLTIALEAINSANLKAHQIVDRMPDKTSGQMWLVSIHESLDEAEERINQTREEYVGLWEAISRAWYAFDDVRKQQGLKLTAEC